jgi:hypothetical protein
MNDWGIFVFGCFAAFLCAIATGFLLYAVETDVRD